MKPAEITQALSDLEDEIFGEANKHQHIPNYSNALMCRAVNVVISGAPSKQAGKQAAVALLETWITKVASFE